MWVADHFYPSKKLLSPTVSSLNWVHTTLVHSNIQLALYSKDEYTIIRAILQAILMSGRRQKKLILLIFKKLDFKGNQHWICIQNKLSCKLFYFKLFVWPPDVKRTKSFRGFSPLKPHKVSPMSLLQRLPVQTLNCILQQSKTQSLFKSGH